MTAEARRSAVILSAGETATTDYFLTPHLERLGYEVTVVNSGAGPDGSAAELGRCSLLVISRYLPGRWLRAVNRLRLGGVALAYFMDDDLFDIRALPGLPLRYQWKIATQALMHRARLLQMCGEFWVSTAYLAEKYARHRPILLHPAPSRKTLEDKQGILVCYHGTASHRHEIEWLVPIMKAVQARSDNVHFELFGTRDVARGVAGIPRVSVLHPMSWPNYLAFTSTRKRDIALAPLLPGAFNAARGATKFYDYARMGAVGLYSNAGPYREFIRHGVDGLLLDNEPAAWEEALLALAHDEERRRAMAAAIRQRALDETDAHGQQAAAVPGSGSHGTGTR